MPTLLELFQKQKLSNGQTAAQKYEVQNSKDNKPSSANGILNATIFPLQQIARRNLSNRIGETLIEEETTGLRVLNTLASPVTYGTEIIRLTSQTTEMVDVMNATNKKFGAQNASGILSGILNTVRDAPSKLLSKIGQPFPQAMIPSRIITNQNFIDANVQDKIGVLNDIKKDGAGSLLGKFLKQNAQGSFNQLGSQILGGGIKLAKDSLKNILLGARKEGQNKLGEKTSGYIDVYSTIYPETINRHELLFTLPHLSYSEDIKYSDTLDQNNNDDINNRNDLSTRLTILKDKLPQKNLKRKVGFNSVINNGKGQYGYNYKTKQFDRYSGFGSEANSVGLDVHDNSLESKRGFNYNTINENGNQDSFNNYTDDLNKVRTYKEGKDVKTKINDKENTFIEDLDFISLKFYSVYKQTFVPFRATISGLTETFSPSWESNKYIGNPFNFYTYNSIERSVSFKFVVYSLSVDEHKAAWDRIRFLSSLVYPQAFGNTSKYVVPPFIKLSLGDIYNKKEGFIESLTYTIDDNTPWEIGLNGDTSNYKLPTMINVDITIKFVESASTVGVSVPVNLYGFGSKADDVKNNIDGSGNVIPKEMPKTQPSIQNENAAGSNTKSKKENAISSKLSANANILNN